MNTVAEMKNALEESIVHQMKQRIKSEIWKIKYQKTSDQNNRKKRESKNGDSLRCFWDNTMCANISSRGTRRKRESAGD